MQWQRRQRLRYARKRIFDRDRQAASVSSIALECGYSNLSGFSRDFKELFAVSPSEYLRS
jgi:AraC-like DNA-binding protein